MTLKDLAKQCGLSVSFLSKYENGKSSITVTALRNIAQALNVPIKVLIASEEEQDLLVIRCEDRFSVVQNEKDHTIQDFLTKGGLFDMQVTVMHMPPHTSSGELGSHDGEEFIYVLEGEIVLKLEGHAPIHLGKSDMAYYFSQNKHGWENKKDEKAVFLAVTSSKGF